MEKASNGNSSSSNKNFCFDIERFSDSLCDRKVSGGSDMIDSESQKNFANTNAYLDIGENNLYKSLGTNFNTNPILINDKSANPLTPDIRKNGIIFPFDITKKKLNFIEDSPPILLQENPGRKLSPPPGISEGSIINYGSRREEGASLEALIIENQAIDILAIGNLKLISTENGKNDKIKKVDSQQVKIITGEVLDLLVREMLEDDEF